MLLANCRICGFTLIELLITGIVAGILITVAVSGYQTHIDNSSNRKAIACVLEIQAIIQRYHTVNFTVPDSLDDISLSPDCTLDPWNNPYRYLKIEGKKGKSGNRKDRSENPLNSDYDLYSMGKDGKTKQSLRPKASHDDIIRAKNGGFVGLASAY